MSIRLSPNHREVLSAISTVTSQQEYLTSTNGVLNVSGSGGGGTGSTQYTNGTTIASPTGTLSLAYDGTNVRALKSDVSGQLYIGNFPTTQSVSVASLPLPSGAATAVNQATEISSLATIATNTAQIPSLISTNNSSSTILTSGSLFTGTTDDVTNYSEMRVSIFSDVSSAVDGLSLQQSSNNINWDVIDTYTIAAGSGKTFVVPRQEKFFRIVYTNGGIGQTAFRLQTILNRTGTAPSSNRASDGYTNETDLVQNQTFNMLYNGTTWDRQRGDSTNGSYVQVKSTVAPTLPSTIINGQKAASTSAAALGTGALTQGVIIEALSTNTVSVFIGGSGVTASTGIELLPGGSTSVAVANISAIFIISASGTPVVSWIGS